MKLPSVTVKQRLGLFAIAGLLLLTVLCVVIAGMNILEHRRMGGWARAYARVLPLPIASIEGEWVLYRDVLPRWDKIETFYARQALSSVQSAQSMPTVEDRAALQKEVYDQLLRERLLARRAEQDAFRLADDVVSSQMDALLARSEETASSTEPVVLSPDQLAQKRQEFREELDRMTGWTYDEYLAWVLRPALLEEGLARRAEIAGQSLDMWKADFEQTLADPERVKRYLDFSSK